MDIEILQYARVVERLLIVVVGGMCIYLGYRLFDKVQKRQGELTVKGKDRSLTLRDVAPGIYFVFFGSLLLGISLYTQLKFGMEDYGPRVSYHRSDFEESGSPAKVGRLYEPIKMSIYEQAKLLDQQVKTNRISKDEAYGELQDLILEEVR